MVETTRRFRFFHYSSRLRADKFFFLSFQIAKEPIISSFVFWSSVLILLNATPTVATLGCRLQAGVHVLENKMLDGDSTMCNFA